MSPQQGANGFTRDNRANHAKRFLQKFLRLTTTTPFLTQVKFFSFWLVEKQQSKSQRQRKHLPPHPVPSSFKHLLNTAHQVHDTLLAYICLDICTARTREMCCWTQSTLRPGEPENEKKQMRASDRPDPNTRIVYTHNKNGH